MLNSKTDNDMKTKYFKGGLFLAMIGLLFTACDSDRDDNPTIDTNNMTTEFKLNTPAYSTQLVDLATSDKVNFTWNQPNYGFTVPVTYSFQVSADDTWKDAVVDENGNEVTPATYADVTGSFTSVKGGVSGKALNNSICTVKGWDPESTLPASMEIYVRCKAMLADLSVPAVYSNSVKLTVVPSTPVTEYAEFIYAIGDDTGWKTSNSLRSSKDENELFTGEYSGLAYLNTEFKFRSDKDEWIGDDWGVGAEDGTLAVGAGNIVVPEPGFYKIDVNMGKLTYELLKVETISIIGTVNGSWDNDTDMTYNPETGAWEVTAELNAGAMKFRVNHDWTWSWGGANGDPKAYNNLTWDSGKDLDLDASGTYFIQLFVSYEGNNKVVITNK